MNENLTLLFAEAFSTHGDSVALELPTGPVYTYRDLDRLTGQMAAVLLAHNVARGDRVVVQIDKSPAAVALYLAVLRIGAVFVPLNTSYTAAEVQFFLADAEPRMMVGGPDCRRHLDARTVPVVKEMGVSSEQGLWSEALRLDPWDDVETVEAGDLAAILYTSGTTGRSKGAMLSHGALASNAITLHKIWGFEPDDVLIHALPIFHVHGLFVALHTAMLNASRMLFLPVFKAAQVRGCLKRATVLMGVPTFYSRLLELEDFSADDCAGMRLFVSGSAPMTELVHEQWRARTGYPILERYGMTEAGMITSNPLDGDRIPGTVGYPLPQVAVRVCDDQGQALPPGQVGQIEICGPNLFSGYWKLPEKTAEDMRDDGFFITGDLGQLSEDGRLSIAGRAKDLIISGGYNIYPKEIEAVLDDIDGVAESAVVGVPHTDMGEGVVAVLVADSSPVAQALIQQVLDSRLARFKHPRKFVWRDELPRNAMGKVQKNTLRDSLG